jgi:hypothetical protein
MSCVQHEIRIGNDLPLHLRGTCVVRAGSPAAALLDVVQGGKLKERVVGQPARGLTKMPEPVDHEPSGMRATACHAYARGRRSSRTSAPELMGIVRSTEAAAFSLSTAAMTSPAGTLSAFA